MQPTSMTKPSCSFAVIKKCSGLAFISSALMLFHPRIQPVNANTACQQAIFDTAQRMQNNYDLNVLQPATQEPSYGDNPYPGMLSRIFLMRTNFAGPGHDDPYTRRTTMKARDFMNSPKIQLDLATRVLSVCNDTSIIIFGFANSGYIVPYFRMPSGQIREGIGLECSRNSPPLEWGYYCS